MHIMVFESDSGNVAATITGLTLKIILHFYNETYLFVGLHGASSLVPRLSPRANEKSYCKRRKAGWGLGTRL